MKGAALALALTFLLAAGVGALALAGCATTTAVREHDWKRYEPDSGWAAYRPTPRPYEADPAKAAVGEPGTTPSSISGGMLY